ncbi:uncharacterized protein LOC143036985 isoform X2 [Oratosquilla oratoria]
MKKPVRVWSWDRKTKQGIVAESFEELLSKGAKKLKLRDSNNLRVVLEEDGTLIDEKYWETLKPDSRVIFLALDQEWQPEAVRIPKLKLKDTVDGPGSTEAETAQSLLTAIKENPTCIALLSLADLEIVKDADVSAPEISSVMQTEDAKEIQKMCVEFYVQRRREADALEFVELLKKHN